ncbi:MAG: hypothetical protein LBQ21_07580 [Clostridiales Family XIII bacterium]|jgi:hypothetical protein|nr:hypothetical protein [Clostridiales Family XIII bacterium]
MKLSEVVCTIRDYGFVDIDEVEGWITVIEMSLSSTALKDMPDSFFDEYRESLPVLKKWMDVYGKPTLESLAVVEQLAGYHRQMGNTAAAERYDRYYAQMWQVFEARTLCRKPGRDKVGRNRRSRRARKSLMQMRQLQM